MGHTRKNERTCVWLFPGRLSPSTTHPPCVDFGGVYKEICIQYTDVSTGDYILAHAGMAIARLDREEAEATLADFETLARHLNPESHVV